MAKFSHSLASPYVLFLAHGLPKDAQAFYLLDKMEIMSFRRRKLKRIKEPPYFLVILGLSGSRCLLVCWFLLNLVVFLYSKVLISLFFL